MSKTRPQPPSKVPPRGPVGTFLRDNGLTLALTAAFLATLIGMLFSGWVHSNAEAAKHGEPMIGLWAYFMSGGFQSALFENWESEFLQMAAYVVFTAFLFQRGSAESADPDAPDEETAPEPRSFLDWLYQYSLGLALAGLFILSFVLHWFSSVRAAHDDAIAHGQPPMDALAYLADPEFWFESLQNWQSEFLSTAVLVVLSIVLRFRGSPESKTVTASHRETGR